MWAPNARRVSVVGDFNYWNPARHPMRKHVIAGVWDIFLPGVEAGAIYKYDILGPHGERLPQKADPVAWQAEVAPGHRLDRRRSAAACLVRRQLAAPPRRGAGPARADLRL